MADSFPDQLEMPHGPQPGSTKWLYWVIGVAVLVLLVGLVVAISGLPNAASRDRATANPVEENAAEPPSRSASSPESEADTESQTIADFALIDDDGSTLWASPTDGPPLDLAYLPPGVQIILALRPAEILTSPEGSKLVAALGPTGASAIESFEHLVKLPLNDLDQLLAGWQVSRDGTWQTALIATAKSPFSLKQFTEGGTTKKHAGQSYEVVHDVGYYTPAKSNGRMLVVAPPDLMDEILALDGFAPPLSRGMERLVDHTDSTRNLTLLFAPNFLFSDGSSVFNGEWSQLREPLLWFFGDSSSAVAVSIHFDENLYLELLAVPTLDASPAKAAGTLAERVAGLPNRMEDYVANLAASSYGRRVLARFPGMIRKLAVYTRHDSDKDCAMLRSYLPAIAGHNLLLGTELTLAESGGKSVPTAAASSDSSTASTLAERLQKRTSLRFGRDTLETALKMLSTDVGVPITIRGPDLQADGITKNQSFGIDAADKPAEEILVEILRLANPDKLATGPADARQKLVYVVQSSDGGGGKVVITTRAAAKQRGDRLPAAFVSGPPK